MLPGGLTRDRDFLKLWGGQAISKIGSTITSVGLPLTAASVMGASPLQMGILAGAWELARPMAASRARADPPAPRASTASCGAHRVPGWIVPAAAGIPTFGARYHGS
ncbi:MAG: hypothetical protein ABSC05_25065 [Candidatus Solibacter sp.]|jgi:hypothetical protein